MANSTELWSICNTLKRVAAATDHQLLLSQRYVVLAAPTSWMIGHQERKIIDVGVCACMCSYLCVWAGLLFSKPRQQPMSVLLSVRDLFELCMCTHLLVCVCIELCVHSNVHLPLLMYMAECLSMSCFTFALPCGSVCCIVHRSTLTSSCHLLFPIINSAFSVTADYSLWHP